MDTRHHFSLWIQIAGDLIVLLLVTVIGLATHDTLNSGISHFLANFLPFTAGWFLAAPFIGAYDQKTLADASQLWRPFWAAILSAPMGGLLRSLALGTAVVPVFVIVMGGTLALALLAWRVVFFIWVRSAQRKTATHG